MLTYKVDEIDGSSQFHQHFMSSFFCGYSCTKKSQSQTVIREKLRKALSCQKFAHKKLMKLTPDRSRWKSDFIVIQLEGSTKNSFP